MSSSWTFEIDSAVPAPRLFKAAILDWHNLAPKIASDKIVSAAPVEGDGNVGSIRQFNFAPGLPFSFVKERLDFLDVEKCEAKSTLVEGGGIGVHIESASTHIKVEPKAGGSVVKVTGTSKPLPGVDVAGESEKAKGAFTGVIKGCEAYLVANPDAYN
ncbi:Major pollen allergen Bet v 1-B [Rhynchospora pubera]|uniref:Major pollen allergen Bet v 1-B n=1 Tax=Rhynchospora pubera TaxID=906938 RepID=A0AAV8HMF9_9POAL|nr:Major pollen allergen Bet v 1-B [Rhynchospora pubera]KAJ4817197.1 Major pollen allergen Bet v 1-B [Rhynchospora pubera]